MSVQSAVVEPTEQPIIYVPYLDDFPLPISYYFLPTKAVEYDALVYA